MNKQVELPAGTSIEPLMPPERDPMRAIARAAIAHGRCALDRAMRPEEFAEKTWPFDPDVALVIRASTTPTTMANAPALVRIAMAVLPALAPQSAGAALFDVALKLQFGADANAFTIPSVIPPNGAFVGEAVPKPVGQGLSSAQPMNPCKIAAIAVASAELMAQAAPEALIQQMLAEAAGPALDAALFSNAASSANRPAGLLNGLSAIPEAPGGAAVYDAILADLGALGGAVAGVAGNGQIVFVMAPQQAVSAKLAVQPDAGYQILASSALAAGTIVAVATNALACAIGVPGFETSTQATLQMDDAAAGSVMTGPTSSMFQTSNVALKMILPVSWARRAASGVAFMTGVGW